MPPRIILRIEIGESGPEALAKAVAQFGMTQVAVTSRAISWVLAQPEHVQLSILGLYPSKAGMDTVRTILEDIARQKCP